MTNESDPINLMDCESSNESTDSNFLSPTNSTTGSDNEDADEDADEDAEDTLPPLGIKMFSDDGTDAAERQDLEDAGDGLNISSKVKQRRSHSLQIINQKLTALATAQKAKEKNDTATADTTDVNRGDDDMDLDGYEDDPDEE